MEIKPIGNINPEDAQSLEKISSDPMENLSPRIVERPYYKVEDGQVVKIMLQTIENPVIIVDDSSNDNPADK